MTSFRTVFDPSAGFWSGNSIGTVLFSTTRLLEITTSFGLAGWVSFACLTSARIGAETSVGFCSITAIGSAGWLSATRLLGVTISCGLSESTFAIGFASIEAGLETTTEDLLGGRGSLFSLTWLITTEGLVLSWLF
ncbi:MAG: hypothetical protein KBC28_08530 [Alphaproteobacteria bacterium]|nr:hypothetical protein [Alphaproteobacteria bacterium]